MIFSLEGIIAAMNVIFFWGGGRGLVDFLFNFSHYCTVLYSTAGHPKKEKTCRAYVFLALPCPNFCVLFFTVLLYGISFDA
jgi:hypothetical protein